MNVICWQHLLPYNSCFCELMTVWVCDCQCMSLYVSKCHNKSLIFLTATLELLFLRPGPQKASQRPQEPQGASMLGKGQLIVISIWEDKLFFLTCVYCLHVDTKRLSYILFQGHLPVLGAGQGAGSSEVGGTSTKAGEGRGGGHYGLPSYAN